MVEMLLLEGELLDVLAFLDVGELGEENDLMMLVSVWLVV